MIGGARMNPYGYQQNAVYQTPYYGSPCCSGNRGVSWIAIALVVFFLVCALVPAVKEQTKINSNAIFSKIEEDSVVLYRDIEQVEKHDSKAYVLCSCNKKFPKDLPKLKHYGTSCSVINANFGSLNDCKYSCIGLGDCAKFCPQNAIEIHNNTAVITNLCNGCGKCVDVCPKNLIKLVPSSEKKIIACNNSDELLTTCSLRQKEVNISYSEKKGFKIWHYCYKIFSKIRG